MLKISEDAYLGDAQYTVSVDGGQIGGTLTAVAAHGTGQDDTLTVLGDWTTGPHRLTVTFVNDAYDGSPSTDRNLYVDGVAFDGSAVPNGTAALLANGPKDFGFGTGNSSTIGSGSDNLVLQIPKTRISETPSIQSAWTGPTIGGTLTAMSAHGFGLEDTLTAGATGGPARIASRSTF